MRTIEANGKSIDEAIFNGLKQLEISIDEVDIEIVQQESKGVLGFGAKPAIVRLIEREPEAIVVPEYLTEEAKKRREERAKEPRERSGGRYERRQGSYKRRDERPRQDSYERAPREEEFDNDRINSRGEHVISNNPPRRQRSDRQPPRRREESYESEAPQMTPREDIEYSAELAKSEPSAIFLKGLLENMNIDAEVLVNNQSAEGENAAHTRLYIKAGNMGVLIGHRGETLDALQYLTSLYINRNRKEKGYTRITIDIEGYRGKREETLTRLARKVAAQVRATGRARALEPMNPYERRILHATLQPNPYVSTHSEGEEPYRRVVVEPKR